MRNWLLPENISDILPNLARQVESAKAATLELFRTYGYELVMPPMLEYIDALMADNDPSLLLKTFRVIDQLSGRQLGIRADITPQVARIDAHLLSAKKGVTRLCYAGSVLHARPEGLISSREPLQIGAELYGCADGAADLEIIELMLATLNQQKVANLQLSLGHISIFRALITEAGIKAKLAREILALLQIKDSSSLSLLLNDVAEPWRTALLALPELYGTSEVLDRARIELPKLPVIDQSLNQLSEINQRLQTKVNISFDLAELSVDCYHSGLLFAVFALGWSNAIARGGRYDKVGQTFGRARPATGFSFDLRDLLDVLPKSKEASSIRVSSTYASAAHEKIAKLRASGEVVVVDYLNESSEALHCNRELLPNGNDWHLVPLK